LRLATSEKWKDRNSGESQERTQWHTVAIFSEGLCRIAEQFLRKGSKVYIEGRLETRKWQDQSGNDRYSTEVVLRPYRSELVLLDGRSGDGRDDRRANGSYSQGQHQGRQQNGNGNSGQFDPNSFGSRQDY